MIEESCYLAEHEEFGEDQVTVRSATSGSVLTIVKPVPETVAQLKDRIEKQLRMPRAQQKLATFDQMEVYLKDTDRLEQKPLDVTLAKDEPSDTASGDDMDNLTLDQFALLDTSESLGKGSFGVVQKVRRKGTNEVYALKSMRKHEVIDGNLIDQVELEIQVQRKLKHPNVLRLYRHFEDGETVYLLLELCGKGELYQILRTQKNRRFDEEEACNYFLQVALGLQYLHTQNVVHRDIKPENLLVNDDNVLKIGDFGWCAVSSTLRTTFCGTLDYLAPEMIQGKGHDHTLDVWSAGVLLYEMVVGRPPFQSTNHGQLISKILKLELNFPESSTGSPPLQDLVRRLLKTEPSERMPLKDAIRHPWVLKYNPDKKVSSGIASRTNSRHRESSNHHRLDDEVEPDLEPRTIGSTEMRTLANEEANFNLQVDAALQQQQQQQVSMVSTPGLMSRGLQSPRVPGLPQYVTQPAAVTRSGGTATTATSPIAVNNRVSPSPTSTPVVVPRVTKDQPIQIISGVSTSTSMEKDDLSRTWRKAPSRSPVTMSPSSLQSTSKAEPSVVYRPLVPNSSPIGPHRNLDGSSSGNTQPEAPGTPVQRAAFRSRTLSPPADLRMAGAMTETVPTGKMTTAEAVQRGLTGRQPGSGYSAPQRRELQRREPREPSLHHASSQHALQRGGAVGSTGSGEASGSRSGTAVPSSPQLQPRRLSHAQPPSISESTGRSNLNVTGLSAPRASADHEDRHSARCHNKAEDPESQKNRRPKSDPAYQSGNAPASREQGRSFGGRPQTVLPIPNSAVQSRIYMPSSQPWRPSTTGFSYPTRM